MTTGNETESYEQAAAAAMADPAVEKTTTEPAPQQTESTPAGNTEASTTAWNGEQFAFDQNGQRIVPKSIDELKQWAIRGRNYSQRAAELNKRQQEIETTSKQLVEYKKLADAFDQNPAFKKQIMDLYVKSLQGETTKQEDEKLQQLPPEIKEKLSVIDNLRSETESIKSQFEEIKKKEEDQLLDQEIKALRDKFKDEKWDEDADGEGTLMVKVMKEAMETGLPLEKCYKILSYDKIRVNTEAQTRSELAKKAVEDKKKGIVSTSYEQKPQPKGIDIPSSSYHKLVEAALSEMK